MAHSIYGYDALVESPAAWYSKIAFLQGEQSSPWKHYCSHSHSTDPPAMRSYKQSPHLPGQAFACSGIQKKERGRYNGRDTRT